MAVKNTPKRIARDSGVNEPARARRPRALARNYEPPPGTETFQKSSTACTVCSMVRVDESSTCASAADRKSVVWGKSVSVRVDLGGRGIIKNKMRQQLDSKR